MHLRRLEERRWHLAGNTHSTDGVEQLEVNTASGALRVRAPQRVASMSFWRAERRVAGALTETVVSPLVRVAGLRSDR
jgi:hypothetical protein